MSHYVQITLISFITFSSGFRRNFHLVADWLAESSAAHVIDLVMSWALSTRLFIGPTTQTKTFVLYILFRLFCCVINIPSTISVLIIFSFFSFLNFSFLKNKKINIHVYQFLSNNFMFVKYTKSCVYTCHNCNCIS